MIKKRIFLILAAFHIIRQLIFGVEGMWIPLLIGKFNIQDMQEKGFRLSAEDIYSINKACLANAVVLFGRGCTGEVISPDGLILTNYHCGYSRIQSHSTVEKDYLKTGFWAGSHSEELPNSGLTVSFLIRIEDVTKDVLSNIDDKSGRSEKEKIIQNNIQQITGRTTLNTGYSAEIKAFFFGREYYMFVYETFRDIRLVGAPPASIGKFGGDTDNWIWPRHTGDFSLFRIYADSANKPADYSPANIPYKPRKFLKLSVRGIRKDDFTMVLGYPARTNEYLMSDELNIIGTRILPPKIELRGAILEIMKKEMEANPETDLKYASKYAGISNAWKKWTGVVDGFNRFNTIEKKKAFETRFCLWLDHNPEYRIKYGGLLPEFTRIYKQIEPYYVVNDFGSDAIFDTELLEYISGFVKLLNLNPEDKSEELLNSITELKNKTEYFFRNYEPAIDRMVFAKVLELYSKKTENQFHPEFYLSINKKYKGNYKEFVTRIFNKSIFTHKEKILDILDHYAYAGMKKIINDPAFRIYSSFGDVFRNKIFPEYDKLTNKLDSLYPEYLDALMAMQPDKVFYPDANFTMRMTYGKVEGYSPGDAVEYNYSTTLKGVMEKENPDVSDYIVPGKLKTLFMEKDYGRYGIDGKMPLCFVASNHTSGGNSGSPVFNADGYLIGINFDRNWEGTMNDYMYDPEICRNISLDIRYVLFIIDKFADEGHIIDELTIVN